MPAASIGLGGREDRGDVDVGVALPLLPVTSAIRSRMVRIDRTTFRWTTARHDARSGPKAYRTLLAGTSKPSCENALPSENSLIGNL